MEFPEPANDHESSGFNFQRLAVGAGALIVVLLTVVVAIFLTLQDLPPAGVEGTPVSGSPTVVAALTATFTPQPQPLAGSPTTPAETEPSSTEEVASPTATASLTPIPVEPTPVEPTPLPPTHTPLPPPTFTPTALPPAPTDTPPPVAPPAAEGACTPPANWVAYVAQVGDTYSSLATRTGTSVFELQRVNCPETATLSVGETVYLPTAPASVPSTSTPRPDPAEPEATATPTLPEITEVAPRQVDTTGPDPVIITILGKNFRAREVEFRVELRGVNGAATLELRAPSLSDTSFEAIVPPSLPVGTYDLIVTNATDRADIRTNAVEVVAAP